jgi:hypothetical protein
MDLVFHILLFGLKDGEDFLYIGSVRQRGYLRRLWEGYRL